MAPKSVKSDTRPRRRKWLDWQVRRRCQRKPVPDPVPRAARPLPPHSLPRRVHLPQQIDMRFVVPGQGGVGFVGVSYRYTAVPSMLEMTTVDTFPGPGAPQSSFPWVSYARADPVLGNDRWTETARLPLHSPDMLLRAAALMWEQLSQLRSLGGDFAATRQELIEMLKKVRIHEAHVRELGVVHLKRCLCGCKQWARPLMWKMPEDGLPPEFGPTTLWDLMFAANPLDKDVLETELVAPGDLARTVTTNACAIVRALGHDALTLVRPDQVDPNRHYAIFHVAS